MKKARKPISLLLALVMALSLAATPAWAATPTSYEKQTIAVGGAAANFDKATIASFTTGNPGLYVVSAKPTDGKIFPKDNDPTYNADQPVAEVFSKCNTGGHQDPQAYWLKGSTVYNLTYDTAKNGVAVTAATPIGLNYIYPTLVKNQPYVLYVPAGQGGTYDITFKDASGNDISNALMIAKCGAVPEKAVMSGKKVTLEPDTYYAVRVTAEGAFGIVNTYPLNNGQVVRFDFNSETESSARPSTISYNFNAPYTGLYTLTTVSYATPANGTPAASNILSKVEVKEVGGAAQIQLEGSGKEVSAYGYGQEAGKKVQTLFLVGGQAYTVTATIDTSKAANKGSTPVYYYTNWFQLVHAGHNNTTGQAIAPISYPQPDATDSAAAGDYSASYFLFEPAVSGYYRILSNAPGELEFQDGSETSGAAAQIKHPSKLTYTLQADSVSAADRLKVNILGGTIDNLKSEKGFNTLGAGGWFDSRCVYLFKFTPDIADTVKGTAIGTAATISPTISFQKDGVNAELRTDPVTCAGMSKAGTSVVRFIPSVSGELSLRFVTNKTDYGAHTGLSKVAIYDENGWQIKATGDLADGGQNVGDAAVSATFDAKKTYYIAMTAVDGEGDNANVPSSCTVSVEQKDGVTVLPGDTDTQKITKVTLTDNKTQEVKVLSYDSTNKVWTLEGLTIGRSYTVTASATGYFTTDATFTAGATGNSPVLVLVASPSVAAGLGGSEDTSISFGTPVGNKLTVELTAKNLVRDDNGQYWVGIRIPKLDKNETNFWYGYGEFSSAAPTLAAEYKESKKPDASVKGVFQRAGTDKDTTTDSVYINAFPDASSSAVNAWVQVAYDSGNSVIYQLRLKDITRAPDEGEDKTGINVVKPEATAVESTAGAMGKLTANANKTVKSVTIGNDVYNPLKSAIGDLERKKAELVASAWNTAKGWAPAGNDAGKPLGSDCFAFYDRLRKANESGDTKGKLINQLGNLTPAGEEWMKKELNHVLLYPILKVVFKDPDENNATTCNEFTLDINAFTRTLVTDKDGNDTISNYNGEITRIFTQYENNNPNAIYTRAKLAKSAAGTNENMVEDSEKITAIQLGADQKVNVDRPIQLKVDLAAMGTVTLSSNSIYIRHKHGNDTYVYEINEKTGTVDANSVLTFVSPHGLSEFTFSKESTYKAAYIERNESGQLCRIWYNSIADAIRDARQSETITIFAPFTENIAATNNNGASNLVFNTPENAKNITGNITINGSAVVKDKDNTSGVWNGKAQGVDPTANDRVRLVQVVGGTAKLDSSTYNPAAGETVRISVTAQNGYAVSGLNVKAESGTNPAVTTVSTSGATTVYSFRMPAAKVTVTPVITRTSSDTVTVRNANSNAGTVTVDNARPVVGATVTVTATPKTGYRLASITAYNTSTSRAVSLTGAGSGKYTFKMQSGGVTVTTTWATTNTVSIVDNGYGTVTASDVNAKPGTLVSLEAKADDGFRLTSIQVRGEGDTPVTTFYSGGLYYFTMPASGGVTVTPAWRLSSAGTPYTDAIAEWAKNYVAYAYQNNLMTGTTATTFGGANTVTRGEIWTILARYDGFYPKSNVTSPWYNEARVWAMNKSNAGGGGYVSDGTNGGGLVTREQLATMLWRYAGSPTSSQSLASFPDANKIHSEWSGFEPAMRWAVEKGILSGKTSGNGKTLYLDPTGNATRNEVAKMIAQFDIAT